jgi:cell division protease FtsH
MDQTMKTVMFWLLIMGAAIVLWQVLKSTNAPRANEISYSQFLSDVDAGNVATVKISNTRAEGTYRDGTQFRVSVPASQDQLLQTLRQKNVQVWYSDTTNGTAGWLLTTLAPFALIAGLWFFMVTRMRAKSRTPGSSTDSSAPLEPR